MKKISLALILSGTILSACGNKDSNTATVPAPENVQEAALVHDEAQCPGLRGNFMNLQNREVRRIELSRDPRMGLILKDGPKAFRVNGVHYADRNGRLHYVAACTGGQVVVRQGYSTRAKSNNVEFDSRTVYAMNAQGHLQIAGISRDASQNWTQQWQTQRPQPHGPRRRR